jgi:hypothetical protein
MWIVHRCVARATHNPRIEMFGHFANRLATAGYLSNVAPMTPDAGICAVVARWPMEDRPHALMSSMKFLTCAA